MKDYKPVLLLYFFSKDEDNNGIRNMGVVQTNRSRSDFEKLIRILTTYCKQKAKQHQTADEATDNDQLTEKLRKFNDIYASIRDEFKVARAYWLDLTELISAIDELAMCKMRMELVDDETFKLMSHTPNLIRSFELRPQYVLHENTFNAEKALLGQRLRQLFFLKNTQKVRSQKTQYIQNIILLN